MVESAIGASGEPIHTTGKLSQARRNLGAASVAGKAYFVGGCTNTGIGRQVQFICDDASDVIDVYASA